MYNDRENGKIIDKLFPFLFDSIYYFLNIYIYFYYDYIVIRNDRN